MCRDIRVQRYSSTVFEVPRRRFRCCTNSDRLLGHWCRQHDLRRFQGYSIVLVMILLFVCCYCFCFLKTNICYFRSQNWECNFWFGKPDGYLYLPNGDEANAKFGFRLEVSVLKFLKKMIILTSLNQTIAIMERHWFARQHEHCRR